MILGPTNLKDAYKSSANQLIYCESGFGCRPTASGRKVYGRSIMDGESVQYDHNDFVGELKEEFLLDWAKQRLAEMGVKQEHSQE